MVKQMYTINHCCHVLCLQCYLSVCILTVVMAMLGDNANPGHPCIFGVYYLVCSSPICSQHLVYHFYQIKWQENL